MNILIIADVPDWAIGTLTKKIEQYNSRYHFDIVYAHPRNVQEAAQQVKDLLASKKIDVWHAQYWNSGVQMIDLVPELKDIPSVVTQHNHKHLNEKDWKEYFTVVVSQTVYAVNELSKNHPKVALIPHGIDLDEFDYIKERKDDGQTVGYIGRVLEHKNLDKICEAAKNLNYHVLGSGYIDKPKYWQEKVQKYAGNTLEFRGGVGRNNMNDWQSKNEAYDEMTVFVMYSTEEVETGTLPLLEAMAKGVPVMATHQGMARDIIVDGENGIIFNESNFEEKLVALMGDRDLQEKLRRNARKTIMQYSEEKMAVQYGKLYNDIVYGDKKLVSVIVPTYNRVDNIAEVIKSVSNQTYNNIELVIVDDGSSDETQEFVLRIREKIDLPIVYIRQEHNGYGLASARNRGAVEARGKLLVFCDDRLAMDKYAVERFVQSTQLKHWNYGQKQVNGKASEKMSFVENFSAIHKHDLVHIGMFNERIEWYGGMSQDVRIRSKYAGIKHNYVDSAIAHAVSKAEKMKKPEEVWKSKLLLWKLYE